LLKRVAQTVSYLPYFVSWVVVIGIFRMLLTADGGLVNNLLLRLGAIDRPISFLMKPGYIWPVAVISDIWKLMGWNCIIYIAAISNINPELYEAAEVDGASRWRRLWHITLAGIRPTIVVMFILGISTLLVSTFEQMYMLNVGPVGEVAETLDTYIYRVGLKRINYGIGTALQLVRTAVLFAMVAASNKLAKLVGEEGVW
jgi:putative aldouronate transport system permease protein